MRVPAAGLATTPSHRTSQTGYGAPGGGLRSPAVGGGLGAAAARLPAAVKWMALLLLIAGMAMVLSWTQPAGDASAKVIRLSAGVVGSSAEVLHCAGWCPLRTVQAGSFYECKCRAVRAVCVPTLAAMCSCVGCRQQER